ncbi:MAG: cation acetate symporter [Bacteroidetes bacterium]|nr:cation acetate symporter [Bacteroidota bacterium]MBT5529834.1 cation acetate symporter [Cytophagia bacterium]MBT3422468.1 cation acetate symporter [Bacteroidota bacterium]MBT3799913.1 cation acetate symporter [Bacteroidota bacterium]MBT3935901.1 cation acetate symporter [Bacteroidota bacterium]
MIYGFSLLAIVLFCVFVLIVLGLSFYFGSKTKSSSSYFAAGGTIHWAVNGIAFAGDYLSAASFLGICGMIAFVGYDGFLYSIGYLAGWIVALFLVAEPLKRLGKFTFTDALDSKFNSKAIQLTAAISTLIVSIFYLIPQMVGAGTLVEPLLGLPHWVGVVLVGAIVIFIVATAGMTSTTYVQFIKGGLLIIFSTILTIYIFNNGLNLKPDQKDIDYHEFVTLTPIDMQGYTEITTIEEGGKVLAKLEKDGVFRWFTKEDDIYFEALSITHVAGGEKLFNGEPKENGKFFQVGHMNKIIMDGEEVGSTGKLGPFKFLSVMNSSELVRFIKVKFKDGPNEITAFYQKITPGREMLIPGLKFKIGKGATPLSKLNFISLMLALFLGTASLPHILIRYYTVPSQKDARKSTIVAISAIGFFYILTLFMGLGAATHGVLNMDDGNMSGPLLAKAFGIGLFAIISAIAFATILGTVSGLIVASSGAIAHDLIDRYMGKQLTDDAKVRAGKIAAFAVGCVAIVLGILFRGMNVSFLVGWAFAVAASANLPAILMLLFWKKTTAKGIASSIVVGIISALGIIITGPTISKQFFGTDGLHGLDAPAIISFTLALLTLIVVSLFTQKDNKDLVQGTP